MTVTLRRNLIQNEYHSSEVPIEKVESYKYVGIGICRDLRWNKTVDELVGKANRSLGLLVRSLSKCSHQVREKFTLR